MREPTTDSLYFKVKAVFPSTDMRWAGGPDYHSAVCPWMDGYFVATSDDEYWADDVYMVGLYPPKAWEDGEPPATYISIQGRDNVVAYLDDLTELQPEATDYWAWAVQWTEDAVCDGRIAGLREAGTEPTEQAGEEVK